jgi:enolase-phosphatase E1
MLSAIQSQIRIILLDIEGTTTPVDFVYQTLFPYARNNMESFFREYFREPEIVSLIQNLHTKHQIDKRQGFQPSSWIDEPDESRLHSAVAYSQWLMAKDSKCTALKSLQGKIWQEGYTRGKLHGQVYADVPPAFKRWRRQKREICIYSSGSILAQQLLFRSIASGDLTPQIAAFFDTSVGAKTETESYRKIIESLAMANNPSYFLFISDAMKEIKAAYDAGMQAILCNRDKRAFQLPEDKIVVHSFDEVFPD